MAEIESAARVAGLLHSHQPLLKLSQFRLQDGQLHLRRESNSTGPDVIWGQPPGSELTGEPLADTKLHRLLDQADHLGNPPGIVIDLRTP